MLIDPKYSRPSKEYRNMKKPTIEKRKTQAKIVAVIVIDVSKSYMKSLKFWRSVHRNSTTIMGRSKSAIKLVIGSKRFKKNTDTHIEESTAKMMFLYLSLFESTLQVVLNHLK